MYLLVVEIFDNHPVGYEVYTVEELNNLATRQLLKILRSTYAWDYDINYPTAYEDIQKYRNNIKYILSTREHIPNKIESKLIRKQKIKRGV